MSNINTNPVEFETVPCACEEPVVLPETEEVVAAEEVTAPAPKKSSGATRFFALLLIVVSALALFLNVQVIKGNVIEEATLLNSVLGLFAADAVVEKIFNVLPAYTANMQVALVYYALVIAIVLTVLCALIALLSGKFGFLKAAAFFFATGFSTYAVCGYVYPLLNGIIVAMDTTVVAYAIAGAIFYVLCGIAANDQKSLVSLLQVLYTLAFSSIIVVMLNDYSQAINAAFAAFGLTEDLVLMIFTGFIWVNALLAACRITAKKGLAVDLIRYILQIVFGGVLVFVAVTQTEIATDNRMLILAIVIVALSVMQIVIRGIQIEKKVKEVAAPEVIEEPVEEIEVVEVVEEESAPEFTVEEFAEAMPYEGGPVAGVEMAEEVVPTAETKEPEVVSAYAAAPAAGPFATAGYDYYNSRSFDPFIASLNEEERASFTEIFILKYKGIMPELPDYKVGGNNKEFFQKIFIYLGQYRDRIPDGLLAKIYQFAVHIS